MGVEAVGARRAKWREPLETNHLRTHRVLAASLAARVHTLARKGRQMSQKAVEHLIGKLATDEEVRLRFRRSPREFLESASEKGEPLTIVEIEALAAIDPDLLDRFADTLDARLQRVRIPADGRRP